MFGVSKSFIKEDLYKDKYSKRGIKEIETLYRISGKGENDIDDETFRDLNLEDVFRKIDFTYSSPGEEVLYKLLRNPVKNVEKVSKRSEVVDYFSGNIEITIKLREILFHLGRDKENTLLEMISEKMKKNVLKHFLYMILGQIMPILLIAGAVFLKEPRFFFAFFVLTMSNIIISNLEREKIKISGISYLSKMLIAGKKVRKLNGEGMKSYIDSVDILMDNISEVANGVKLINMCNALGGVLELIAIPFLIEETTFYKVGYKIDENAEDIYKLYYILGELDALISISVFKKLYSEYLTEPVFTEDLGIKIEEGLHPMLLKGVPNSINIKKNGIVLTGTNMSGKSTFLRMIGVNMVLAQSFNIVCAKSYEAPLFRIVSSISPLDDIKASKSYYLAEAEGILRIINALEGELPVFSAIDEIFRGTNPVERIASSSEILKYINSRNAIGIVATHDRELTDILKHSYDFYYFSEDIDSKEGITFDYKLKKGVATTRNAIKLLEYVGYPSEIIEKSYNRVTEIEKYS